MNRILLYVILFLLVLGLIGHFTPLSTEITAHADLFIAIAEKLGIIVMLLNGSFINTSLFRIALFFLGLTALGALFKILHYAGADELLLYSPIALFCVYLLHFYRKKPKQRTDVLKVFMLLGLLILSALLVLHIISAEHREALVIINEVLFWVTFLDFLYTSQKQGVLLKK